MPKTRSAQPDESTKPAQFHRERTRLLRLAYRYLGSISDAEDIVQDAWLRFSGAGHVEKPAHFLSRVVTNLSLDRLKSAERRRVDYVGPWLPEPLVGDVQRDDGGDSELDISFAVMRALESLSPGERAALFLHELYDMPFEEIADILHRTPAACRKLASRARQAVRSGKKRYRPSAADVERLIRAISESAVSGEHEPLASLLAEDVESVSDGGGKAIAALRIIRGRQAVSRFLAGIARKAGRIADYRFQAETINDAPGLVVLDGNKVDQTFTIDLDDDGLVAGIYIVRNPDKLRHLKPGP